MSPPPDPELPEPAAGSVAAPELPWSERARRSPRGVVLLAASVLALAGLPWLIAPQIWPDHPFGEPAGLAIAIVVVAALALAVDRRPRVTVTPHELIAGTHRFALADLVAARPAQRRPSETGERSRHPVRVVATLGARRGVGLDLCTPEGLPYHVWVASDTPEQLSETLHQARERGLAEPPPSPSREGVARLRGPRGAMWQLAVPFLVLGGGVLPWLIEPLVGERVARLLTVAVVAAVALPALRLVRVDERRLRSAGVRLRSERIVAARTVARRHSFPYLLRLRRRHRSLTVWGPATVVVCVVAPEGRTVGERLRATRLLAFPRQVDLGAVLPAEVVDRRLPRALDDR